eukprot:11781040-Prorocentrum_lima.AAC.1
MDPEYLRKHAEKVRTWKGPESILERWKSYTNKPTLPTIREEDTTIFADAKGGIILKRPPQCGSPITKMSRRVGF